MSAGDELTLDHIRKARDMMRENCEVCEGTGVMSIPVFATYEDQFDHFAGKFAGKDVTPSYTIHAPCGVCG